MKRILYIGNFISNHTRYVGASEVLLYLLEKEGYNIQKASHKKNKFLRLLDMMLKVISLRKSIDVIIIDTFSTTNFYYALMVSQLSRLFKIPYIPILHGGNLPKRLKNDAYLSSLIFKNAKTLVAPSHYLKYEFEKKAYSVQYIPNTIPIGDYKYQNRKLIKPKLLWLRAFEKTYNPTMAIEVLRKLLNEYPSASLCMVGPTRDETLELSKDLVKRYQLESQVQFTGVLSKKEWHTLSEKFDIFINTTTVDNTPVSVIEAMALGLPIISTKVGGMPYLIEHQKEGVLVTSRDVNAMVAAIITMIENPVYANYLAMNARKKVEQFDWKVVKEAWNKVLN
ncbi:MAG: glycosyltransferase family 4 protein [Flavobacteriaceae bacterium]|nr:glycosyltransferase family 4 protein [Flavobacteriaceae bacterium]